MNLRKVLINQQEKSISKKRKIAEKSKQETLLDQAMLVIVTSKKELDTDDAFGQSMPLNLKSIPKKRTQEFIKHKV